MEEEYSDIRSRYGAVLSWIWYWFCTVGTLFHYIKYSLYWRFVMFGNYLKIALRNIKKHRGYSFINISGLAIGIASSILIFLFVVYELSYDKFYENKEDIYRIAMKARFGNREMNHIYASSEIFRKLLQDFPEIDKGVKILTFGNKIPVAFGEKAFYESRFFAVDSTFFEIFSTPLIYGNPKTALRDLNTVVISRKTAMKYFGTADVLGREIEAEVSDKKSFVITGVFENVPENTHFHYDLLISTANFPDVVNSTVWDFNIFNIYLLLKPGTSKESFGKKLKELPRIYMGEERYNAFVAKGNSWEYVMQPLTSIHLDSNFGGEFEANGSRTYVIMFSIISVLILLIACINFINLSTAKSTLRAKEVGLRKVVGSSRRDLIVQFLSESVLLSFLSLALSIAIVHALLPMYRDFVGRQLQIHYFDNFFTIPLLFILGLTIGVLSGFYPAFSQSSIQPIASLKGKTGIMKNKSSLRGGLVVCQFALSICLIVCTLIVLQQLKYLQNKKLGFEGEQVLVVNNPGALGNNVTAFKETLRQYNNIVAVSGSNTLPGRGYQNWGFGGEGIDQGLNLNIYVCDYDFLKTLKIELAKGRFFSKEHPTDSNAAVLNEKAAEQFGWDDPIGKRINDWLPNRGDFTVIGVVKNFHYESLYQEIEPQALFLSGGYYKDTENCISVRIQTEDISRIMTTIENTWKRFVPNMPFEYSFLDENYNNLYINERKTKDIFSVFSFLAIFISCLGLFGLASFTAERKTKEIGIRKVLGASTPGISLLLSKEFVKWVLLANIIAWPVAYYFMSKWLQNFAYRAHLSVWIFILSGLAALVIALLTVSFQTIKAATANPVDSLRYE